MMCEGSKGLKVSGLGVSAYMVRTWKPYFSYELRVIRYTDCITHN